MLSCLGKPTWCIHRVPWLLSYFRLQLVFGIPHLVRSQLFSYPVIIVPPRGILQTSRPAGQPSFLSLPACDLQCPELPPSHRHTHAHQAHDSSTLDPCHPSLDPVRGGLYSVMEVTAQPVLAFLWRLLKLVDRIHFTRYGMYNFCCSGYVCILK